MKTIKIKIEPLSAFKSKLQSDTIFGQFCWMYKYIYGEDKLEEILKDYDKAPFIVFSDGFVGNTLPKPILKPLHIDLLDKLVEKFTDDKEIAYSLLKKLKKISSMDIEELSPILDSEPLTDDLVINELLSSMFDKKGNLVQASEKFYIEHHVLKNSVNRILNTTTEGLYQSNEFFINSNVEIYVKFDEAKIKLDDIENTLENIGKTGFGADKSTGKGRFEILSIDEDFDLKDYMLPDKNKTKNGFISLSSGLITDDNISLNFGKTFTKFGKLGGERAITGNHFKNPVILYKPGSTFFINEYKEFYGNATSKVFKDNNGFHSGFMMPLFVNLEKEK